MLNPAYDFSGTFAKSPIYSLSVLSVIFLSAVPQHENGHLQLQNGTYRKMKKEELKAEEILID